MPVSDFITHQIDRPNPTAPASVSYRDEPMAIDDHASQLLNELKQVFAGMLAQGRQLQAQYSGQIREKAQNIDLSQLVGLVKGK